MNTAVTGTCCRLNVAAGAGWAPFKGLQDVIQKSSRD